MVTGWEVLVLDARNLLLNRSSIDLAESLPLIGVWLARYLQLLRQDWAGLCMTIPVLHLNSVFLQALSILQGIG